MWEGLACGRGRHVGEAAMFEFGRDGHVGVAGMWDRLPVNSE